MFIIEQSIGILIANELIGKELEYHDEYERIVVRIPGPLARSVEKITEILFGEEDQIRCGMFGAVMRILGPVVMKL